jgi:hypothetical protein
MGEEAKCKYCGMEIRQSQHGLTSWWATGMRSTGRCMTKYGVNSHYPSEEWEVIQILKKYNESTRD